MFFLRTRTTLQSLRQVPLHRLRRSRAHRLSLTLMQASNVVFDLDELIIHIASQLDAGSLAEFQQTCRRFSALDTASLWRQLCLQAWRDKPRFELTSTREAWLADNLPLSWQERYWFFRYDAARCTISSCELSTLQWTFNFAPSAGGRGALTRRPARFVDNGDNCGAGMLHLDGYPPLAYRLDPLPVDQPRPEDPTGMGSKEPRRLWRGPLTMVQHMLQALFLADAPEERAASAVRSVTASQHLLIANFPPHSCLDMSTAVACLNSEGNVSRIKYRVRHVVGRADV